MEDFNLKISTISEMGCGTCDATCPAVYQQHGVGSTVKSRLSHKARRQKTWIPGHLSSYLSHVPSTVFTLLFLCGLLTLSAAQLQDVPPTNFIQQPQAGIPEIKGNTKVLLCRATGTPAPVYRWLKDEEFLTDYNITEQSLKLQDIKKVDAGEYQCIASNTAGAILSDRVDVTVAYLTPFPHTLTREKTVDQGQACIIDLPPIDSYPPPNIQWLKGNRQVLKSHRTHITLKNQLVLLETRINDNNEKFHATATNLYTSQSSDSQEFTLRVQNFGSATGDIPPSIVIPPTDTKVVQNTGAAKLECVANARSLNYLFMNWFRKTESGRVEIRQDNLRYIFSRYRRQLTIKNPVLSDSGMYECEAVFNRTGGPTFPAAVARANLTVLAKPSFITGPQTEINRDFGSDLEILCQAEGAPTPEIKWYRNAKPLEDGYQGRYSLKEKGKLFISEVNPTDSGMFQCFVTNEAGEINAATWLKVLSSPPEIVRKLENSTMIADDTIQLPCEVTGAPKPIVTWYRVLESGRSEDLTGSSGRIQVHDSELLITRANVDDSGKYVCNATNTKGVAVASAFLRVYLRTAVYEPPQDASVIKGSTHTIHCKVRHDEAISVSWSWFHNDEPIIYNDRFLLLQGDKKGNLKIRAVRNSDIGTYRCDVISRAGNDTGTAHLKVIELPYPPSVNEVHLNADNTRAVDVRWSPGFDGNSPIKRYIVQFRLVPPGTELLDSEGWVVSNDQVPASMMTYTVPRLLPARSYQFRVSAVNDVGEGMGSKPSQTVTLPQQPPSGPPRDVVGSPRSETSIILRWKVPDEDKWNGPLQGFIIRFKPSGYPDETLTYENITSRLREMYELKGLIVFQEYEIATAAYNRKGVGVYSSTIYVRTMEGKPTQAPKKVSATALNSTSIRIRWIPPSPQYINGINQGYKIEAKVDGESGSEIWVTIPSDTANMLGEQTANLYHLHKFTNYQIRILCFTSKGDGPSSPPVSVKTMEDVPDAVGMLWFDNVLDTSLQVMWTSPPHINGILIGYTLSYMRKNETISKVSVDLSPTTLNYTITGLTATTTYTIEVFAKTRVGAGPLRSADIGSGVPPERPAPPRNLAITNIQASSVLVQFIPGFSGHTSITKWVIEAQINTDDEWMVIFEKTAPEATSLEVTGLRPYTNYILRMLAENVAGRSMPSDSTRSFQTIQAEPSSPPSEVTVRADNETAIRVRWKPLASDLWNGEGRGYLIQHKEHSASHFITTIEIRNENANSYTFTKLEEWTEYDVRVASYNKVGFSEYSTIATDRTRESVPSQGPAKINATALSSTSIRVQWSDIPEMHKNGKLLGFKVIYSIANMPWLEPSVNDVNTSLARETILTSLKKYTQYRIQVLGYTRIGDGALSSPAPIVKTFEDVPGPPSSVYFPDVTYSTVLVVWSPPKEPNGIITGYSVAYYEKTEGPDFAIEEDGLGPNARDLSISHLQRHKYYVFRVSARTKLGIGAPAVLEVFTIVDRTVPDPPSEPQIGTSAVGNRYVTVNWQPSSNGYSPIRNYTIQIQPDGEDWRTLDKLVPPDAVAYTITELRPNTKYKFRIAAVNDIGSSQFSGESDQVTTKQAAPESPPLEVIVAPKTTTSVLISWKPPPTESWNGDPLGYQVWYRRLDRHTSAKSSGTYPPVTVTYPTTSVTLINLNADVSYEIKVNAFNGRGHGPFSRPVDVYVGEAVPTEAPSNAAAQVISSTEIKLRWDPPSQESWNGDLLGYKIFYWIESMPGNTSSVKTVAAAETETVLSQLRMFNEYAMFILAFNAAGDGPNITVPVIAKTLEGVPGKPGSLRFMVTSLTSLNVSWEKPSKSNGIISFFEVSYYQDTDINGESRSVQVKLSGDRHYYEAKELNENVKYIFSVRAQTSVGWGPSRFGNITTGPQKGSPERPSRPSVMEGPTSVTIEWENSEEGDSPIIGYIIQAMERGESKWDTSMRKTSPEPEAVISLLNLKPNSEYQFRVIALNNVGISAPSLPSRHFKTLKIEQKPFYQQWWFLIIVALTGVIFIIIVISLLCLTGRKGKNKYKDPIPKTTIHLQPEPDNVSSNAEDGGFPTFEMRRSQRRSERRPPKTTLPPYTRSNYMSPPRPSPGSVNYSDGEESKYPDEESSSLTEKPSEISSSASDSQASESEAESEKELPPPPFPNHYTNGNIQQSWHRNNHLPSRHAAYNYTDSEPESQYAVTMNGGHVIMNNMAGSRAPLPGFSSFV